MVELHQDPSEPTTPKAKRGRLHGGALTEEALGSSRRVLSRTRGADSFVGLQQWFTPPEAARLVASVFGDARAVLDPTAGDGALLSGFEKDRRFGIEIDRDHVKAGSYAAIAGDAQKVVPMLRAAGATFPAVALNPPFGLSWHDAAHAKGEKNSTVLAYLWALDLIDYFGQGVMICGRDRLAKEVLALPEASGIYAVVELEGPLFEAVSLPTAIVFFVKPENRKKGETLRLRASREELPGLAAAISGARASLSNHVSAFGSSPIDLSHTFDAVYAELAARRAKERGKRPRFDVSLRGRNKVASHPSAFAKLSLANVGALREVQLLNAQHTAYFGQNTRAWHQLLEAEEHGHLSVDPDLKTAVEPILEEATRLATPLFPVKEHQRLGWLTDLDRIRCKKDDPEKGYEAGEEYPLHTSSKIASETEQRVVENKSGEHELRRFVTERRLLEIRIGDHAFDEAPESISYVVEHFELPDPGCVATRFPQEVARNRTLLEEIASENGFELKPFQLDHLSRLLVKRRGLIAHDPGLGKTIQQLVMAEALARLGAKPQALFVFPQDLLQQWSQAARDFFGRKLEEIRTPAQARDVARRVRAGEPGWFATYFEALSTIGRKKEVLPEKPLDHKIALRQRLAEYKREKRRRAGEHTDDIPYPIGPTTRDACPGCRLDTGAGWDGEVCPRCSYVHRRILVKPGYSHLTSAFKRGVKSVDELSEIRGDDSLRSKAVRGIARGPFNIGATGTPISNYVEDSFWGLWVTLGNATPCFPYDYHSKPKFIQDFAVIEYLMGRDKDGESHLRKRRKILPKVTNLSQFWRLVAPGVSRCRKEDTGEPIVPKTYHPIRVPLGVAQRESHRFWLNNFVEYFSWLKPDHPMVREGLVEKWAAALGQLWRLEHAATLPASDAPSREWPGARAKLTGLSNFTPATMKVLELAMSHAAKGEKVLIGSDLIETGVWLSDRLREKGVRAVHITEEKASGKISTKNPRKRAAEVHAFMKGDAQVLCAGVGALKLGHNLDMASTVVLHGLPYSHMSEKQFLERVHRLTSKREVSVYVIIPRGSLAERKWQLLKDKGNAAELAFDGELSVQPEKPVDWNKVLREMKAQGIPATGAEVLEADVEAAWKQLAPLKFMPRPKAKAPDRPSAPPSLFDVPTFGSLALADAPLPDYEQPALF